MNEKPARATHPSQIFFKEIAEIIANFYLHSIDGYTEEAEVDLANDIKVFLEGGGASTHVLKAIASFFSHEDELWQNLWKNYLAYKAPESSSESGFKKTREAFYQDYLNRKRGGSL